MKIIDLFSGIGGFALGFQRAGYQFTEHYFSEIDKQAIANYKYNFPHAKNLGDIITIQSADIAGADIITFGSPCQDFSLAGKRAGLKGNKSSLIQHAIALITLVRPSIFIWENVKGAYSSNAGADFWALFQAFANIDGYRFEQQLLNTSWLLPQNRERIYLIGHLTGRSIPGVFPIGENDFPSTEKTESQLQAPISTTLKASGAMRPEDTYIIPKVAATLTGGGHSGGLHSDMTVIRQLKRGKNKGADLKICPTISSNAFQENNLLNGVRRLTEIECERLQGFPDNWTQYGDYNGTIKPIAKTQRYKLIGNAVTVDIVTMIAKRLKFIENENHKIPS